MVGAMYLGARKVLKIYKCNRCYAPFGKKSL